MLVWEVMTKIFKCFALITITYSVEGQFVRMFLGGKDKIDYQINILNS
jgi:hypothetical protein